VRALDFQVDVAAGGGQMRFGNVVDEFTRKALASAADRSLTADGSTVLLDKIIAESGRRPAHLLIDNGPNLPPPQCATGAALATWTLCSSN
jgi:putative transposase